MTLGVSATVRSMILRRRRCWKDILGDCGTKGSLVTLREDDVVGYALGLRH
jgi:hypothetical protein